MPNEETRGLPVEKGRGKNLNKKLITEPE